MAVPAETKPRSLLKHPLLQKAKKGFITVTIILGLSAIYCSNVRLIAAGDSLPTALTSLSLVVNHSVTLDEMAPWLRTNVPFSRGLVVYSGGHYRSVYPIGQSLLAAPLIAPAALVLGVDQWEVPRQIYFARIAEKYAAALIAAFTVIAVFATLRLLVAGPWPWLLASVFAFGTVTWPIASQALWQQTGGQLCTALAFYCFARWIKQQGNWRLLLLMGLCCAMAIVVRPFNLLLVPAFLLPILLWHRSPRAVGAVLLFPAMASCALAMYNLSAFGNLLGGYGQFVSLRSAAPITGLAAILISPGRGLFFFSPVLLFAFLPVLRRFTWKNSQRSIEVACVGLIVGHLVMISNWHMWWGGYSWGWRLLTEIGPPLVILMALGVVVIRESRFLTGAFALLAAISIGIQAVGAFYYPSGAWDAIPFPVNESRVWDWKDNPVFRSFHAGMDPEPYHLAGKLRQPETWTLATTWQDMDPLDIATLRWWAVPAPKGIAPADDRTILALARQRSESCYLDTAELKLSEDGTPLSLKLVGWAFDAASGTSPGPVFVEISSPGRSTRIYRAGRWNRPDVASAFRNDRLLPTGVSVDVLLEQPASSVYDVKILQPVSNAMVECTPARGHLTANK